MTFTTINPLGKKIGLHLNVSKCELICTPDLSVEDDFLKSFQHLRIDEACLLGIPLSRGPSMDKAWTDRLEELTRAVQRMTLIDTQDAFILLKASFGLPRNKIIKINININISFNSATDTPQLARTNKRKNKRKWRTCTTVQSGLYT
jgi:hypothetical protein